MFYPDLQHIEELMLKLRAKEMSLGILKFGLKFSINIKKYIKKI